MKFISTQDDWNDLLKLIHEKTLTPVVGQEMFKYKENNELSLLDSYLSKKLLEKFDAKDRSAGTLTDSVNYLLIEKKSEYENISEDIITYLLNINLFSNGNININRFKIITSYSFILGVSIILYQVMSGKKVNNNFCK